MIARIKAIGTVENPKDARESKIYTLRQLWDDMKAKGLRETHRMILFVEHPSVPNAPESFDFRAERSERPTSWYEFCEREFGR